MGLGSNPRIHTRIIREQELREVGKLEQDLVFGDAGTKEVIKFVSMHTDLSHENKLRLLMVYAAIYPKKFEGDKGSQLMQGGWGEAVCRASILPTTNLHYRHLIGFFLFLSLTIYTATTVSDVSDYYPLQHFAEMLNKAGLHDVHSTLVYCLTSFSKMPDFGTLSGELMASLPYINSLSSVSRWHIMEHLSNCLPERFSHLNETNDPSLNHDCEKKIVRLEKGGAIYKPESGGDANTEKKQNKVNQAENTKKLSEEKRLMKKQERSRKAELKDETAKQKQLAKERKKLEKHKFSEKDIVAVIDPKVLSGLVGGRLGKGILVIS